MILSGDIGGTKAELALYERAGGRLVEVKQDRVATDDYPSLEALLDEFLTGIDGNVASAAFGIAGPVIRNRVSGTNIPWTVEEHYLSRRLRIARVEILNDLEATAFGLEALDPADFLTVQPGRADENGAVAVIAAGTGLGEASLWRDDGLPVARA